MVMFGRLPELKINELDTYKGMYCGLCKQLGWITACLPE